MTAKRCFLICPIGEEESETRKNADRVLRFIIKPVLEERGYNVVRADKIEKSGVITNQIIEHVLESDIVIADLSERNPNVFYELALRHAARKPLVQLIRKGEDIPFDVSAMRTIHYSLDLEGVEKAKKDIGNYVDSSAATGELTDSPVSIAIDLYQSKTSDDPERTSLASINSKMGKILSVLENNEHQSDTYNNNDLADKIDEALRRIDLLNYSNAEASRKLLSRAKIKGKGGQIYPKEMTLNEVCNFLSLRFPWLSRIGREILAQFEETGDWVSVDRLYTGINKEIATFVDLGVPEDTDFLTALLNIKSAIKICFEDHISEL